MKTRILSLTFGAAMMFIAPQAQGAISYTLDNQACSGSCSPSPFGTVTLQQFGPNTVLVSVNLASGENFAGSGGGNANALDFNLNPATPAPTINVFTTGFAIGPAPDSTPYGSFQYSVTCTTCQGGQSGNPTGPLLFTVTRTGLTLSSFVAQAGGYFFASDIVAGNGKTGTVAADGATGTVQTLSDVPEPITMSLVGAGLLMIGLRKRIRRNS
jgi:hypothetical protein